MSTRATIAHYEDGDFSLHLYNETIGDCVMLEVTDRSPQYLELVIPTRFVEPLKKLLEEQNNG